YRRRSPKLTMTCPLLYCGLKLTTSRPLPPTVLPPPQSQNSWADAGAICNPVVTAMAPAVMALRQSKRKMRIISGSRVLFACPSGHGGQSCLGPGEQCLSKVRIDRHRLRGLEPIDRCPQSLGPRPKRLAPLDADRSVGLQDPGCNPRDIVQGIEKQRSQRRCAIWATREKLCTKAFAPALAPITFGQS